MKKLTILFLMAISLQASAQVTTPLASRRGVGGEAAGYLFAYFEGGGDQNLMEQLRFAVSEDAQNWYALNGNRPIIASDSISESGGIRDPHILRGEDGCYYIVATDMHTYDPKQGWGANPGIVLLKSKDLVNWTHAKINLSKDWSGHFGDAYWVWAPQTIYDRKAGKYMIYFTLQRNDRKTLITYYAYANKDFTAFESEPKVLFSAKYGSIDADIIEKDGVFHLFYKGNTKDENGKEIKNGIQQATSKKLTGPYKENFEYLDAYAGTRTHVEGSGVFQLNNSEDWILMYDLYSSGRYEFQRSKDLKTFTKEPESFRKDFFPRHGTVMSVTADELERLQQKWGYVLTHEFESTGNPIIRDKHTADPAVLVEGDTLWLFAGHDAAGNQSGYVMKDWLLYSTTDMKHWTEYPSPLRVDDFKWADSHQAYAGHVARGKGGRYYWYVSTNWCGIGVAVSDKITGPYKDALGKPLLTNKDCFASKHSWACIDPAILIDDDGTPYIIWGNKECYYAKLKDNMTEIDGEIHRIDVPNFTEAPWMHKYNGKYYLTYASEWPEKIAYAVADHIGGPYTPMGIISEIAGNSNTTHPAIIKFRDRWLFFSHNGGLPDGTSYSRSVIAEPMSYDAEGRIRSIPATTEGMQACTLKEKNGTIVVSREFNEAGSVLPAGQGVLLKAEPGTYVMVPTTRKKAVDAFNQLRGSDEDQLTYGGNFYYVLYEDVQETGWKWNAADGATFVNPAHHAYFVSQSQTTPQDFYPLEQPTSVPEVALERGAEDGPLYNLAGQRVDKSYRSIVVKKGRKLLVK